MGKLSNGVFYLVCFAPGHFFNSILFLYPWPLCSIIFVSCGFPDPMACVIKVFRDKSATELEKGDLFFPWSLFSLSIPGISDLLRSDLLPHSHFLLFICAPNPRISKIPVSNLSLMMSAGLPCTPGWPGRIVTQWRKKWGLCPGKDDFALSVEGYGRIMWGEGSSIDSHPPDHFLPLHIFAPHSVSSRGNSLAMQNLRPHPEPAEPESAFPQDFLGHSWVSSSSRSRVAHHKGLTHTASKAVHLQRENLLRSQPHRTDCRWWCAFHVGLKDFYLSNICTPLRGKFKRQLTHGGSKWKCKPSFPKPPHLTPIPLLVISRNY